MKKYIFSTFFLFSFAAFGQLPSIISSDYTIKKSQSPLKFNKTYVAKGARLYVEAGVVVEGNKLEVEGDLIMLGKEKDSISWHCKTTLVKGTMVAKYCKFLPEMELTTYSKAEISYSHFEQVTLLAYYKGENMLLEHNSFKKSRVDLATSTALVRFNTFEQSIFWVRTKKNTLISDNNFNNSPFLGSDEFEGMVEVVDNRFVGKSDILAAFELEFKFNSDAKYYIHNNDIQGYPHAFMLTFDHRRGDSGENQAKINISKNTVMNCGIVLEVASRRCIFKEFVVEKNTFAQFKTAFKAYDVSDVKTDKTIFLPYRIGKNKYDIPFKELLKRIYDFTGDYEQWVQFQVEY